MEDVTGLDVLLENLRLIDALCLVNFHELSRPSEMCHTVEGLPLLRIKDGSVTGREIDIDEVSPGCLNLVQDLMLGKLFMT